MRAGFHGIGLPVPIFSPPIQWLFRDDFTDTRAAGAVNGTPATPGPGVRTVTDGNSKLSIGGGVASFATGGVGAGNPGLWLDSIPRVAGRILVTESTPASNSADHASIGYDSAQSGNVNDAFRFRSSGNIGIIPNSGATINVVAYSGSVSYPLALTARDAGMCFFVAIGGSYFLVFVSDAGSGTPICPGIVANASTSVFTSDRLRVPKDDLWLPTPLASDGFGSSFGVTDGLGHQEGVAGGIGSGGGGLSWTQQVGTWGTSGGKAVATALTGGVAIATVPLSSANVFAGVAITRTANSVGPVVRYVDADNYVYAVHDGTNSKLVKRVSGAETVLVNVAATYSANASPIIDCNGTAFRLYYNNTLSGTSTISDSVLQSSPLAGIITKDTGNTLDNFIVYAKGAEGQYSTLNQYTT